MGAPPAKRFRLAFSRALSARRGRHRIVGYVDHVDGGMIRGWAFDGRQPLSRLPLDVFYRGIYLGAARTGTFRQDLLDRGVGDGRHGFIFHLPSDLVADVSPDDIAVIAAFPAPIPLVVLGRTVPDETDPPVRSDCAATFFLPLIDRLGGTVPPAIPSFETDARPRIDRLLAASAGKTASAFAEHLALKHGRASPTTDPAAFWHWYLSVYSAFRPNRRTPLSARELSELPALIEREQADADPIATLDPALDPAFAWAVIEARRLGVEDCLVDDATRTRLAAIPWSARSQDYPLSRFMRLLCANHRLLRPLARRTAGERQVIYALIMLLSVGEAHHLQYLPAAWLERMLEDGPEGPAFEQVQSRLLSGRCLSAPQFKDRLSRKGFDLAQQRFGGTQYRGHRVEGGANVVGGPIVDVQLIGPFRRSLGLAESCRRLAAGLARVKHRVNFVDYDIGFSSEVAHPEVDIGPVRPARINILHLNAEEIPEAIAMMPDTFSGSHLVAVPYWELNRPSAVHQLGLDVVDEVWAATRYLEGVFAASRPATHIGMCVDDRFAVTTAQGRAVLRALGISHDGPMIVTTADALSWTQRKNLVGAIAAFGAAFPTDPDVRLVVKTRNADKALSGPQTRDWERIVALCAGDPRIVRLDAALSDRDHKAVLAGADCLLSLHRAEGLGLDMLDAFHLGTPVVATAYSGNMDHCDPTTAFLVDYRLVAVGQDDYVFVEPGHVWAEPDLASASDALRLAIGDRQEAARRATAAQARVTAKASLQVFADRLDALIAQRLREIPSPQATGSGAR